MPYLTPDVVNPISRTRLVTVSVDDYLMGALTGAIFDLTDAFRWEELGAMSPADCAAYFQDVFWDFMESSMVGTILPYATSLCPSFALPCNGAQYNQLTNPEYHLLYAALDTVFIVDADRFVVPDLRDKTIVGASAGKLISTTGGAENHTLTVSEMPVHTHIDSGHSHSEGIAVPMIVNGGLEAPASSASPAVGVTGIGFASLANMGNGASHNNLQPYLALPYCIVYR